MSLLLHQRYALIRPIGQGSSGVTYLALDQKTDRNVVIKRFSNPNANQDQASQKEIEMLQRLEHPQIPRYIDHFAHKELMVSQQLPFSLTRTHCKVQLGSVSRNSMHPPVSIYVRSLLQTLVKSSC